jgi:hypothetical protein
MVCRDGFDVAGFPMATIMRLPARIQAATLHASANHVLCWFAGAVLSLEVLSRGIVNA